MEQAFWLAILANEYARSTEPPLAELTSLRDDRAGLGRSTALVLDLCSPLTHEQIAGLLGQPKLTVSEGLDRTWRRLAEEGAPVAAGGALRSYCPPRITIGVPSFTRW